MPCRFLWWMVLLNVSNTIFSSCLLSGTPGFNSLSSLLWMLWLTVGLSFWRFESLSLRFTQRVSLNTMLILSIRFPVLSPLLSSDQLGMIYLEAHSAKQVQKNGYGLVGVYPSCGIQLVPIEEMASFLQIKKQDLTWVCIRPGKYTGDLAQVTDIISFFLAFISVKFSLHHGSYFILPQILSHPPLAAISCNISFLLAFLSIILSFLQGSYFILPCFQGPSNGSSGEWSHDLLLKMGKCCCFQREIFKKSKKAGDLKILLANISTMGSLHSMIETDLGSCSAGLPFSFFFPF